MTHATWAEHYRTYAEYPPHEQARRVVSERITWARERQISDAEAGPHIVSHASGQWAFCGGPGACQLCDQEQP